MVLPPFFCSRLYRILPHQGPRISRPLRFMQSGPRKRSGWTEEDDQYERSWVASHLVGNLGEELEIPSTFSRSTAASTDENVWMSRSALHDTEPAAGVDEIQLKNMGAQEDGPPEEIVSPDLSRSLPIWKLSTVSSPQISVVTALPLRADGHV